MAGPSNPVAVAPQPPKKPWYRRPVGIAAIVVAVLIVLAALGSAAGGSGSSSSSPTPSAAAATSPSAAASAGSSTEASPSAAASPSAGASSSSVDHPLNQPVTVGGLQITVLQAQTSAGSSFQKPAAGSIYVGYKITFKALDGDKIVSLSDFTVAADGTNQGQTTIFVNDAWTPLLSIQQLKAGNSFTGWVAYEVPIPTKNFVLSYSSNMFAGGVDATWTTPYKK